MGHAAEAADAVTGVIPVQGIALWLIVGSVIAAAFGWRRLSYALTASVFVLLVAWWYA